MMTPWSALRQPHNAPIRSLTALFIAWKSLLLIIALLSPGPGYDTSTQLLVRGYGLHQVDLPLRDGHSPTSIGERLVQKLLRWDAIYFATTAERGYQLEQEWAFGWGFTRLLAFLAKCKFFSTPLFS
jgi:phosphatidylinositol glycan class V